MAVAGKSRRTLSVDLSPPYSIVLGAGLASIIAETVKADYIAIITDEHVNPLYGEALTEALKAKGKRGQTYELAAGEESKSSGTFAQLMSHMAEDGFDRKSAVIALGGGIMGDLAGFTAASYMRGIDFYQVPTSLLAMVDASVGGKTGINLPEGKNLVGAFWQPKAVFIDVDYLRTLPESEFRQGAVELFKHGLLKDSSILEDTKDADFKRDGDAAFLVDLIERSVKVKANIVSEDEKESGVRAYLNLGHSLAHALEAVSDHTLPHGDAVAYGLLFNAKLAQLQGWADETDRIKDFFDWVNPKPLPIKTFAELEPFLRRDKKNSGGKLTFVLLKALGEPVLVDNLSETDLNKAWKYLLEVTA